MTDLRNLSQTVDDLEDFIQREGLTMDKSLLRSKLRYLHQSLKFGRQKSVVRGLLTRLNKIDLGEMLIRTLDIVKSLFQRRKLYKSYRKLTLTRFVEPVDTLQWFTNESYPLKIEYT
jgi:hypothetical protein